MTDQLKPDKIVERLVPGACDPDGRMLQRRFLGNGCSENHGLIYLEFRRSDAMHAERWMLAQSESGSGFQPLCTTSAHAN